MNFMTSQPESLHYLPFWTLYDYIGDTPESPFIPVYVQKRYNRRARNPEGEVKYRAVSIAIYREDSDLVAEDIPEEMLIKPVDLAEWSRKIADWFTNQASEIVNHAQS